MSEVDAGPEGPRGPDAPEAARGDEPPWRTLLDAGRDAVVLLDREGTILHANPAAMRLLGREEASLVGEAFGVPTIAGGVTLLEVAREGGRVRLVELHVEEIAWAGAPAFAATLRDVTGRRRLRRRLRRLEGELGRARRRQAEFASVLAHELRNPLAPILSAVEVLRHGDPHARRAAGELVERQARTLSRLVESLLDLGRPDRGRLRIEPRPADLVPLVARAVESARPQLQGRRLTTRLPQGDLTVAADPAWAEQVVVHLLTNAAKYTHPGGSIALTLDREGPEAVLRVRDDGIGIEPDALTRIFELFAQTDAARAHCRRGLGIGLAMVRRVVELHGGRVAARSDGPGRGSEFLVALPLDDPVAAPATPEAGPAAVATDGGRPASPERRPPRRRLLIVDDNTAAADALATVLRLRGHVPRVVYDPAAALDAARGFAPHAILTDIEMPGLNGYDVARALRAEPALAATLLVACSGREADDLDRWRRAGFDHYLTKPLDLAAFEGLLSDAARPTPHGPCPCRPSHAVGPPGSA